MGVKRIQSAAYMKLEYNRFTFLPLFSHYTVDGFENDLWLDSHGRPTPAFAHINVWLLEFENV